MATLPRRRNKKPHERPAKAKLLPIEKPIHIEIVRFVHEARTATRDQIRRFTGLGSTKATDRLDELNTHHYVYPMPMPNLKDGRNPAVYILDKNGIDLMQRHGFEDVYTPKKTLSPYKLPHYVGLTEIYLKIRQGIEAVGGQILQHYPEHLHETAYDHVPVEGYKQPVSLKPDWGYLLELPNGRVTFLFVEFDRTTENLNTLMLKAKCYLSSLENKYFKKRYGYNGFRVLFVVESEGVRYTLRHQNILNKLAALPGRQRRFWIADYVDFKASQNVLLDPLWNIAGDLSGVSILTDKDLQQSDE